MALFRNRRDVVLIVVVPVADGPLGQAGSSAGESSRIYGALFEMDQIPRFRLTGIR